MSRIPVLTRNLFALGIAGLGTLGVVYGDFASAWPAWVPWRQALLYVAAVVLLLGGAGLLFARTAAMSVLALVPCLFLWMALRVPALVMAPLVEVNWLSVGETAVLAAGAWLLLADLSGARGQRIARGLFALSLIAFGLSHFIYHRETTALVPAWLPFRTGWVYLTGAGHLAAGLGVLFSIVPRRAAATEAVMLAIFTALVWIPALMGAPTSRNNWGEFVLSWAIAAGAWVVAESLGAGVQAPVEDAS